MEHLYALLVAVAAGVIVALIGYYLNMRALRRDRDLKAREQLLGAMRAILTEIEAGVRQANKPFDRRIMLPFTTEMWELYRVHVNSLPEKIQIALSKSYICMNEVNAIGSYNLKLPYGSGYYDGIYEQKRREIMDEAERARILLQRWLDEQERKGD